MRDKADTVRLNSLSLSKVHGQVFGYSIHNEHSCAIERTSFFLNMFRNLQYGGNFVTLGQIFFPSIYGSHERDHWYEYTSWNTGKNIFHDSELTKTVPWA